jgi:hypothetical protein
MILTISDSRGNTAVLLDTAPQGPAPTVSAQVPTLYIGDDPKLENVLTLRVSVPAGERISLPADATLKVDFGAILPSADMGVPVAPAGWPQAQARHDTRAHSSYWLFSPGQALTLSADLVFTFSGLHPSLQAKPAGTVTTKPIKFPGLEHHSTGLRCPVALVDAPQGQLGVLDLKAEWVGSNTVIPTRSGQSEILNRLVFTLYNPDPRQPLVAPGTAWVEGKTPTFTLHVVYADEQPGHGALCSRPLAVKRAASAPTLRASNDRWICEPQLSSAGPYWTLKPVGNNHAILGTGQDASVELVLDNLVCDLTLDAQGDADVTLLSIVWENIPGYQPGAKSLPIAKSDELSILDFQSNPHHGSPVAWKTPATLSWRTLGAERSCLQDSSHPEDMTEEAGDGEHFKQVELDQVDPDRQFKVFAYRGTREVESAVIQFQMHFEPLVFTQSLLLTPNLGITRSIPGTSVEPGVVAPISAVTLQWAVSEPALATYELYVSEVPRRMPPVTTVAGQSHCAVTFDEAQFLRSSAQFRLVARGPSDREDTAAPTGAESTATLQLLEPLAGISLDVQAHGSTQALKTGWGLLLYNNGDPCWCRYVCTPDPASLKSTTWSLRITQGTGVAETTVRNMVVESDRKSIGCIDSGLDLQRGNQFELIWDDAGSRAHSDGAFYRPIVPAGYHAFGHFGQDNHDAPSGDVVIGKDLAGDALRHPVDYALVWSYPNGSNTSGSFENFFSKSTARPVACWRPLPPQGYAALGMVITDGRRPDTAAVMCVRQDLTQPGQAFSSVWSDAGSGSRQDFSAWQMPETGYFVGMRSHSPPTSAPSFTVLRGYRNWWANEGTSFDIQAALLARGAGGDQALFPYLRPDGQPAAIKSLDRFLQGARFEFSPGQAGSVTIPGVYHALGIGAFTIVVGEDLVCIIKCSADAIVFNDDHINHWVSAIPFAGVQTTHYPAPFILAAGDFERVRLDVAQRKAMTRCAFHEPAGGPRVLVMDLEMSLEGTPQAKVTFRYLEGTSPPFDLTTA